MTRRDGLFVAAGAGLWFAACAETNPNLDLLETNKRREGVEVTASGLQYEVLRAADGPKPTLSDTVTVHYKGELVDGTVFDSSYERNEPLTFPLSRVIPGWREACN